MSTALRFHSKLYQRKAIQEAMGAYEEFASFKLDKDGDYYTVEVTILDQEHSDYLADEFANYVLGEVQELR